MDLDELFKRLRNEDAWEMLARWVRTVLGADYDDVEEIVNESVLRTFVEAKQKNQLLSYENLRMILGRKIKDEIALYRRRRRRNREMQIDDIDSLAAIDRESATGLSESIGVNSSLGALIDELMNYPKLFEVFMQLLNGVLRPTDLDIDKSESTKWRRFNEMMEFLNRDGLDELLLTLKDGTKQKDNFIVMADFEGTVGTERGYESLYYFYDPNGQFRVTVESKAPLSGNDTVDVFALCVRRGNAECYLADGLGGSNAANIEIINFEFIPYDSLKSIQQDPIRARVVDDTNDIGSS